MKVKLEIIYEDQTSDVLYLEEGKAWFLHGAPAKSVRVVQVVEEKE